MRTGLVVSGGGAKGAFAVGALEVLHGAGIAFDVISGTSTGALIAPMVAIGKVEELVEHYTNVTNKEILRSNWRRLWWDGLYDTTPLVKRTRKELAKHYNLLMQVPTEVLLCAVNLQTGQTVYFSQQDGDDKRSWQDLDGLVTAIQASANQPIFMRPVEIDGDQYLDGGLREIAPLSVIRKRGVGRIFVIVNSSEDREEGQQYKNLKDIGLRALDLMTDEIILNDIADVDDVVVIRPKSPLPSDGLTFEPSVMQRMRFLGQEVAREILEKLDHGR